MDYQLILQRVLKEFRVMFVLTSVELVEGRLAIAGLKKMSMENGNL
jgi:hypothetical protein